MSENKSTNSEADPIGVLFVCLGNICRSPLAEALFRNVVAERGLDEAFVIDSCGTGGWHEGERAHGGTQKICKKYGLEIDAHRARQVREEDFEIYSLIVAMDRSNYRDLLSLKGKKKAKLIHMRDYDESKRDLDVPDPYYGGFDGFEEVYTILKRCVGKLMDELETTVKK